MTTASTTAANAVGTQNASLIDNEGMERVKSVLMNLNSSDEDILDCITNADYTKEGTQLAIQYLMQKRAQLVSFLSNIFKTLHEEAMAIIHNMRLG